MGAYSFTQTAKGRNATEAFSSAVTQAAYEHGHCGYTGSCAEKLEFQMIGRDPSMTITDQIDALDCGDEFPYEDKWGPAGCLAHDDGMTFTFFGLASA